MCCRALLTLALASTFILVVACEEKKPTPGPIAPPPVAKVTPANDVEKPPEAIRPAGPGDQDWKLQDDAGEISGTIKLDGAPPKTKIVNMAADKYCEKCHEGKDVNKETVIVGKDGGLKNCFVYVKSGLEKFKFPVPAKAAEIDQTGCMYVPHVQGIMCDQKLKIINSDATGHNIHPQPKVNTEWNVNQANKGDVTEKSFAVPEVMVFVKCDVHDWMGSYIGVLAHPFYAVTDENGKFTLPKLNPGEYEIEVWHEKYKTQSKKVTVAAKGTVTADFAFKAKTD